MHFHGLGEIRTCLSLSRFSIFLRHNSIWPNPFSATGGLAREEHLSSGSRSPYGYGFVLGTPSLVGGRYDLMSEGFSIPMNFHMSFLAWFHVLLTCKRGPRKKRGLRTVALRSLSLDALCFQRASCGPVFEARKLIVTQTHHATTLERF